MHYARLFHFLTDTQIGAVVGLSICCAVILLAIWAYEQRLKRRQLQRDLEAELRSAKRESDERRVYDAIGRFRGRQ